MTYRDDDGLTLVEMLVAIFVIGLVLMAMASVAIASMRSVQASERTVRASQLGQEILEEYLALPFEDMGLYTSDAEGHWGSELKFEGSDIVILGDPLVKNPRVPQALRTVERDGIVYTIETAIVWEEDLDRDLEPVDQAYKRAIVELTWTLHGTTRSHRVEAHRSPTPLEQPLAVTITPDVVAIKWIPSDPASQGQQEEPFTIRVVAFEKQSKVEVIWVQRDGTTVSPPEQLTSSDGHVWTRTFNNRRFANGGTLFEVTGTVQGTPDKVSTTIGRALFLHPLQLPADRTTVPPQIVFDGQGNLCNTGNALFSMTPIGALFSDPATLTVGGIVYPMEAIESTTAGARFDLALNFSDLGAQPGSDLQVTFSIVRPVEGAVPVERTRTIPVFTHEFCPS